MKTKEGKQMEKINIFKFVIMKKEWFCFEKTKSFGEGYQKGVEDMIYFNKKIVEELNRLKNDHWDKDAFDRIIERLKI